MRKSVFILLTVFTACLLCKESENMPGTSRKFMDETAHLQSSVFKLSKDLIDSIHEEGIVAYTS